LRRSRLGIALLSRYAAESTEPVRLR